eukprot:99647-Rhodomonas_salina.1
MCIRDRSGTEIAYGGTSGDAGRLEARIAALERRLAGTALCVCYALSGTEIRPVPRVGGAALRVCYALPGTDIQYPLLP